EALEALLPLLSEEEEPRALADVLSQLAELAQGAERSSLLLRAGQVLDRLGDSGGAVRRTQAAVSGQPTEGGVTLLAKLHRASGEVVRAGEALRQASRLVEGLARGQRLLEAAEAFEAAEQKSEAIDCTEEGAQAMGEALPPLELATRFTRLGAFSQALA